VVRPRNLLPIASFAEPQEVAVGLFLNPALVGHAGEHLRKARADGRKRLPELGSLVLLLNACHAAATRAGEVVVSQAYLAARCGGVEARTVRAWERELVACGLLERRGGSGRRRVLALGDPFSTGSPQVIHNLRQPADDSVDTGSTAYLIPEPRLLYQSPLLHRARVSQGLVQGSEGARTPTCTALFEQETRNLARSVRANAEQSGAIASAAVELARELGPKGASAALRELRSWVKAQARGDAGSLAVEALRARARHARQRLYVQRSLFG
jgi:hypothetical protein